MGRKRTWKMSAGERLTFGASLEGDIEADAGLIATNLEVSVWRRTGNTFTQMEDFTVANAQVNAAAFTPEGSSTQVAIGKGIVVRITANETPGSYEVRLEADTDDGDHAVRVVPLSVTGPGSPA